MGERTVAQEALFYSFSLERHVPGDHLLRSIDRFVDLSDIRAHLRPFYSETGRPSIDPELVIRMLIIGYCSSAASLLSALPMILPMNCQAIPRPLRTLSTPKSASACADRAKPTSVARSRTSCVPACCVDITRDGARITRTGVVSAIRSTPSMPARWRLCGAIRSCYKHESAGADGRGRGLSPASASKLNGGCTRSLIELSLPRPDSVKPSRLMRLLQIL